MNPGYDPKARRRRPPSEEGPSPIDAILGESASTEAVTPSETPARAVAKDSTRPTVAKRLPDPVSAEPVRTPAPLVEPESAANAQGESAVSSEPEPEPEPASSAAGASRIPERSAASEPSAQAMKSGDAGRSAGLSRAASVAFVVALLVVVLYLVRRRRS